MAVLRQLFVIALVFCMVKSDDFDTSDFVVKLKYKNKKNKEITGFTQEEKDNLVNIHNAYRSLVRPYGANMIEVTWDDDIAAFAQDWANQCTATHRPNRDLDPWINMGENLYWWYSGSYNEGRAVKYWWDEVQYYTMTTKACQPGEVCGHYVTMVWGKTAKIGCGVARCDRLLDHPDYGRGSYYFVCNYSGRFISRTKPYMATDIPCSACHNTDFPKCRYNLCVTNDMLLKGEGYDGNTAMVGLQRSLNYTSEPDRPATEDKTTSAAGAVTTPTTTTTTTTTTTGAPTTMNLESTTTVFSMFHEIDEYCRKRYNRYVRGVCWRLNNMLRENLGYPAVEHVDKRDNELELEGGSISLSLRDAEATTVPSDQLVVAFEEIGDYCKDRTSSYQRRVCRKVDNKMKEILGLANQ